MTEGKAADGAEETADEKSAPEPAPEKQSEKAEKAEPTRGSAPAKPASKVSSSRTSSKDDGDAKKKSASGKDAVDQVRSTVATVVWVAAVLCALVLAAGALVVALDFNARNGVVKFLTETADSINLLGDLKTFEPDGRGREAIQSARTKEVLVNWGICAVVYLVGGKILDRIIRP